MNQYLFSLHLADDADAEFVLAQLVELAIQPGVTLVGYEPYAMTGEAIEAAIVAEAEASE